MGVSFVESQEGYDTSSNFPPLPAESVAQPGCVTRSVHHKVIIEGKSSDPAEIPAQSSGQP